MKTNIFILLVLLTFVLTYCNADQFENPEPSNTVVALELPYQYILLDCFSSQAIPMNYTYIIIYNTTNNTILYQGPQTNLDESNNLYSFDLEPGNHELLIQVFENQEQYNIVINENKIIIPNAKIAFSTFEGEELLELGEQPLYNCDNKGFCTDNPLCNIQSYDLETERYILE